MGRRRVTSSSFVSSKGVFDSMRSDRDLTMLIQISRRAVTSAKILASSQASVPRGSPTWKCHLSLKLPPGVRRVIVLLNLNAGLVLSFTDGPEAYLALL